MPIAAILLALAIIGPILSGYSLTKDIPRLHKHQTPQNVLRVSTDIVGLIPGLGYVGSAAGAVNFLVSHGKPLPGHVMKVYRGGGMGHGK